MLSAATKRFSDLNASEKRILEAVERGEEARPLQGSTNSVRAVLIEWICTDLSARAKAHRHGIVLAGFQIIGLLDLIYAEIPFPLQFANCEFTHDIWLKSARLRSLIFRQCKLRGLNADSARIETSVLIVQGSECFGEVAIREASIGGGLRADGSTFSNQESTPLVCDRLKVAGGVFLSQEGSKSKFVGEVRFSGAEVGGNFDCEAAEFRNPKGSALTAERLTTAGGVYLRGGHIFGQVRLGASSIGSVLDCRGTVIAHDGERALELEKITVGSHVLLDGQFSCRTVHLIAAHIEGGLRCRFSKIGKLDLRYARVDGPFEWSEMMEAKDAELDFRDATLESIKDDEASWPPGGKLHLNGLRFERFSESVTELKKGLNWLSRDEEEFAQPYRQLSHVYEQSGQIDFSRAVLYEFEKRIRARQKGVTAKAWNALLRGTIGFGFKLWRAGALMALLTLVGIGVGLVGYSSKLIAPSDKDANVMFIRTGGIPSNYARFNAIVYSLEHSLPGMNLGISSCWSANTPASWAQHPKLAPLIRIWFWVQTLVGWLLSIFFLAGISGMVKSQK